MQTFISMALLAVIGVFLALVNFRLLLYPILPRLNPLRHGKELALSGNTLFISDLHLRSDQRFAFTYNLRGLIQARRVSNLVIVGDLFDSSKDMRRILGNPSSLSPLRNILGIDQTSVRAFWVLGSPGHDPRDFKIEGNGEQTEVLGHCALIKMPGFDVVAYHGHDFSRVGALAHACDRFLARLGMEKLWKRLAKVNPSSWVVSGHTHIPGIDIPARVANCGGWQTVPLLVKPARTGLLFIERAANPELVHLGT